MENICSKAWLRSVMNNIVGITSDEEKAKPFCQRSQIRMAAPTGCKIAKGFYSSCVIHSLSFFLSRIAITKLMTSLTFPGNVNFGGTVSAPLFISTQQVVAAYAAGTLSTLSVGSFSSTYSSVSQAYTATLSVGTILNFNAGGSIGTNLALSGTLTAVTAGIGTITCGSLSATFLSAATLSAGTYLGVVFNQTISSGGTTSSSTVSGGTLTVGGSASFTGTVTATGLGINQTSLLFPLDVNSSARITGSLSVGTVIATSISGNFGSITQGYMSTLSVGTILNLSAGGSLGTNITLTGTLISASMSTVFSSITTLYSATITAGTILNLPGANAINFGSDQSKAINAGNIGYQLSTPGSLDVYGAGVGEGSRNVKIWDNVTVPGTATSAAVNAGTISSTLANFATVSSTMLSITGNARVGTISIDAAATGTIAAINMTAADPGDMIARTYGAADRYGMGQYSNGRTRLFTSGIYVPAQVCLSVCGSSSAMTGTFTDVLVATAPNNANPTVSVAGNCTVTGSLTAASANITTLVSSTITAGSVLNLPGSNIINLGSDQTKATFAGNIGYQLTTAGALDVYGGGSTVNSRNVKIWDNLIVPGTTTSAAGNFSTITGTLLGIIGNGSVLGVLSTGTVTGTLGSFGSITGTTLGIVGNGSVTGFFKTGSLTTTAGGYSIIAGGPSSTSFTALGAQADTGQMLMFMNGSARSADGGTLTGTIRNDSGGDLRFINNNSNGLFVRGATGFCGINNAAPTVTLDVAGSCRVTGSSSGSLPLLVQTGSSTSNGLQIQLSGTGGAQDVGIGFIQPGITAYGIVQRAGSNGRLAFVNNLYPGSAGSEQMSILPTNGNVGINNTSPQYTLDVNGSARFTGSLVVPKQTPWTNVTFTSYASYYGSGWEYPAYSIDALGIVRLRGMVNYTAFNQALFTLPLSCTPASGLGSGYQMIFPCIANSAIADCRLNNTASGIAFFVNQANSSNTWVSLSGISYDLKANGS